MKTKEQIIEWLKSNALYDAFAKHISQSVEEMVERSVAKGWSRRLIEYPFCWSCTSEGYGFWSSANVIFLKWFDSDEQTEPSSEDEQTLEDEQSKPSSDSVQSSDRWIFDRGGSKEAPCYMVYAEGQSTPTYKHALMEQATKEADRLAKLLNTKTYVLAAVMEIRPKVVTSAVGIYDMEHQEDNPF